MQCTAWRLLTTAAVAATLTACGGGSGGGGGGSGIVSTPAPPPPSPPPSSPASIKIFASPTAGDYASVGASVAGPGGNLDGYSTPTVQFGPVSTAAGDQAQFRYTSGGFYEVKLAGAAFDRLVPYDGLANPDPNTNNYFQPDGVAQNLAYVVTNNARNQGYSFSELAVWGSAAQGRFGFVGFGVPTPQGSVPVTGSATFSGLVRGTTDILYPDNLYGGYYPIPVDGTVDLNFNFAAGTLGGSMSLYLNGGMNPLTIGTFTFKDTVFSVGSTTYGGAFNTSVPGQNFFLGRFTGPNAQETIGAWALPFLFTQQDGLVPPDDKVHQAFGAWIAKRP